mmetsp:Transcript_5504/g.7566  ORF Transcript_5504/g.7566 Transcript_5504/m.7566 type:complete len:171 (+) Transcript_5504:79-591(+)|eukprot:CAMPEP_0117752404 /NCGR_PEP_ID=MMETSP0947-20121206/11589_1 /TAXON_ID=44440 /ORGANISM="Chattonella subsalsa, Strain CCMP2191" /LENGTH=170 /DNA_ID=CAMNT_0005571047 /DNA_START=79 /DNA_END=591 /DNA_ORIENTATION=+
MGYTKNKKRRRGIAKAARKQKNRSRFIKPQFTNDVVRDNWDNNASAKENLSKLGIVHDANAHFTEKEKMEAKTDVAELFHVPDSDDLKVVDANAKRRVMSEEIQKYLAALIAKHGDDYTAMSRDIKTNYLQYAVAKLARLCSRFLLLDGNQRLVPVPATKHLKQATQHSI